MYKFHFTNYVVRHFLISVIAMFYNTESYSRESKVALIIGNNKYENVTKLYNAVADARALRKKMQERDFQVVYKEDASRKEMNRAIDKFLNKLSSDSIGFIFYAGHGVQINNNNYLIPTDINFNNEEDLTHDSINLSELLNDTTNKRTKFILAIIDACRNNPFQRNGRTIGAPGGLAPVISNAQGIMVVYSAGINQQALDSLNKKDESPNGLFTRELISAMDIPGLKAYELISKVKVGVIEKAASVGHVQTPATYDQSTGDFIFTPNNKQPSEKIIPPTPINNRFVDTNDRSIDTRYINNNNGTVTDGTTGLMWKRCAEGQTWNDKTCAGNSLPIIWNNSMLTGWFKEPTQKSWPEFAGYNDWELPSKDQLQQLVLCSDKKTCAKPTIDQTIFPNTPITQFWTSSYNDSSNAFYVDFSNGEVNSSANTYGHVIRLVRKP